MSGVQVFEFAASGSGGSSIQTWVSPDQIFEHAIRYNPIHNTVLHALSSPNTSSSR